MVFCALEGLGIESRRDLSFFSVYEIEKRKSGKKINGRTSVCLLMFCRLSCHIVDFLCGQLFLIKILALTLFIPFVLLFLVIKALLDLNVFG